MKTTLKEYRDHLTNLGSVFPARCIDDFIKQLFLELTVVGLWEFDREIEVANELYEYADLDEPYVMLDFEETIIPDNEMDVCVRVEFNVDASQHVETDGARFFENISADATYIALDLWGQVWDMSKDKDAIKFVNKVLNDYV